MCWSQPERGGRGEHRFKSPAVVGSSTVALVCCVLMLLLLTAVSGNSSDVRPKSQICYIFFPHPIATVSIWHMHHSINHYYKNLHDTVNFAFRVIEQDGNPNPNIAAKSILEDGSTCDIFLGPLASTFSTSVSPVSNVPVISEGATSTSLSNKILYPFFSRTTFDDGAPALAMTAIMKHVGINALNIVCLDDAFGKSLAAQVRANFEGEIVFDLCLKNTATKEEMVSTMQLIKEQSTSKAIMFAMGPQNDYTEQLGEALVETGVFGEFTFFLSDALCTEVANYHFFDGAFCAIQSLNGDAVNAYRASWHAYNKSTFSIYNHLPQFPDPEFFFSFAGLASDAALLAMSSIREALAKNPKFFTLPMKERGLKLLDIVRDTTVHGTSGELRLNATTGNRATGTMDMFNAFPGAKNGNNVLIGTYFVGQENPLHFNKTQDWFIVGNGKTNIDEVPKLNFKRLEEDEASDSADELPLLPIITGLVIFVFFVLVIITFISVSTWTAQTIKTLVFSEVWVTVWKILTHFIDIASDVLGCYVVFSRDSPLSFTIMYVILTLAALSVSAVELFKLLHYFRVRCQHVECGLPLHTALLFEKAIANTAVVSLVVEDIPMVTMAAAAILQEKNTLLIFSLTMSALLFGMKLGKVRIVIGALAHGVSRKKRRNNNEDSDGADTNSSRGLGGEGDHDGLTSSTGAFSTGMKLGIDASFNAQTPPFVIENYVKSLEKLRIQSLHQHTAVASAILEEISVDSLEFFCVGYSVLEQYGLDGTIEKEKTS